MTTRRVIAAVVLCSLVAFTFLTVYAAVHHGITLGTIVSIGVLLVLGIGIVGALLEQPPEE